MAKRSHLKDYRLNDEGSYEYQGLSWTWDRQEDRPELLRWSVACLAVAAASLIAAGFVPAPGGYAFYALIPYAGAVVATVLSAAALIRLFGEKGPIRDHVYSASVPSLGAKLLVAAVFAALAAAGELVHLAISPAAVTLHSLLFAAAMAIACASLLVLRSRAERVSFSCEMNGKA